MGFKLANGSKPVITKLFWLFFITLVLIAVQFFDPAYIMGIMLVLGTFFCIVFLFSFWFFRDPERFIDMEEENPKAIISPADGKVIKVDRVLDEEYRMEESQIVSIFMSVFNVHVNRYPVEGQVEYVKYKPGKFLAAWNDKASEHNEQTVIGIQAGGNLVTVKQIAGLIAKRIICYADEGDNVSQGQKLGLIKFGSRVDLILPLECDLKVKVGDKVKAGETILGEFFLGAGIFMGNKMSIFPNSLTIGNMFFGYWSIVSSIQGNYLLACYLVIFGGICDALDGKVARLVKSTSDFGVEFDSLADVITFGAAPSFLMFMLYKNIYISKYPAIEDLGHFILIFSFFPLLFSSIRLARFNSEITDIEVKGAFSGLPTPASALTIVSFVLYEYEQYGSIKHFKWLTVTSLIVSYLMISRITYQGFPIIFKRGENFIVKNIKILTVVMVLLLIVRYKMSLLFPLMILFVLSGIAGSFIEKAKRDNSEHKKSN